MKKIFYLLLALTLCACGTKPIESPRALDESIDLLVSNIGDSALSFEEYQLIFEEILDSLQDVVLTNPNAELRFAARKTPSIMLSYICNSVSENKSDSILNLYN